MNAAEIFAFMTAKLNLILETPVMLADVCKTWALPPVEALPLGEWAPAPDDSYCPLSFGEKWVPLELIGVGVGRVLVVDGVLFVTGGDGFVFYFKFFQVSPA